MKSFQQAIKRHIISEEKKTIHPLRVAWDDWVLPKTKMLVASIVLFYAGWIAHAIYIAVK